MRLLKPFLLGIVSLFLVVQVISLFLSSTIRISRAIIIQAHPIQVFNTMKDFNSWKNWNSFLLDSSTKYTLDSPNVLIWHYGIGDTNSARIIHSSSDTVLYSLLLIGSRPAEMGYSVHPFENDSSKTQAEWWIIEKLHWYPWEKFYGIFADRLKGPYLDSGLARLKLVVENSTPK